MRGNKSKTLTFSLADFSAGPDMLGLRIKVLWREFWTQHFSVICVSFYLFLEYVKPGEMYAVFDLLPFVKLSLLGAIGGFFVGKTNEYTRSPLNGLLLLYLFHCFVSGIYAYNSEFALSHINIIYTWVLIYFLITGIINTEKRLFLFVLVYFASNFKMSQFGFFSWAKRGFGFASWGVSGSGWFRNSGELGLEMAMFFAFTLVFAFFLKSYWRGWVKWIMYFVPFSAVCTVIASSSRGAIIGIVGAIFYLSFFSKKKIRAWIATALLLALAFLIMPPEFLARFQSAGQDATSLTRIYYWGKAREMMGHNPYLGVGYYNWFPYFRDHYFDANLYWRIEEAHNTYLQMGAELGYVGLGIFIALVLVSFWINFKVERTCQREGYTFLRAFAMGMNAAGVALVLGSIFLTAFFMPNYWIHFAFTAVLSNVVNRKILLSKAEAVALEKRRA